MRRPTPEDVTDDADADGALRRRVFAELYCFGLVFRFHHRNNHLRKAVTLMVVFVWVALEIGAAYGLAALPDQFIYLRVFVGLLIGRMWDIEVQSFADAALQGNLSDRGDDDGEERGEQ